MHNNASSSEKVHLLLSSHIKIHQHISLKLIWTVFSCKLCLICAYFSPDSDEMTFFNEEINITVCFLQTCRFSLRKTLLMDWSGVDYLWIIVMFLSAVWTLILTAPIHCRGSIVEQVMECYISPNLFWWKNKLLYILDGLRRSTFSANFHFWVNYFFKNG